MANSAAVIGAPTVSGNDTISGGGGNDSITGGFGNDAIDGGAGTDMAIFSGPSASYTINLGAGTVTDNRSPTSSFTPDGTDTLTNFEVLQFSDTAMMIASGTSGNPIDTSALTLNAGTSVTGTSGDDYLAVGGNIFGHAINLGAGTNTVMLTGTGFYNLNLANVQNVTGTVGDESLNNVVGTLHTGNFILTA